MTGRLAIAAICVAQAASAEPRFVDDRAGLPIRTAIAVAGSILSAVAPLSSTATRMRGRIFSLRVEKARRRSL